MSDKHDKIANLAPRVRCLLNTRFLLNISDLLLLIWQLSKLCCHINILFDFEIQSVLLECTTRVYYVYYQSVLLECTIWVYYQSVLLEWTIRVYTIRVYYQSVLLQCTIRVYYQLNFGNVLRPAVLESKKKYINYLILKPSINVVYLLFIPPIIRIPF